AAITTASESSEAGEVPSPLVAGRLHVEVLPSERPSTTIGRLSLVAVPSTPPSLETQSASYWVIALPLSYGASRARVIEVPSVVASGLAGCSGAAVSMRMSSDGSDAGLSPIALLATTVQA